MDENITLTKSVDVSRNLGSCHLSPHIHTCSCPNIYFLAPEKENVERKSQNHWLNTYKLTKYVRL